MWGIVALRITLTLMVTELIDMLAMQGHRLDSIHSLQQLPFMRCHKS